MGKKNKGKKKDDSDDDENDDDKDPEKKMVWKGSKNNLKTIRKQLDFDWFDKMLGSIGILSNGFSGRPWPRGPTLVTRL